MAGASSHVRDLEKSFTRENARSHRDPLGEVEQQITNEIAKTRYESIETANARVRDLERQLDHIRREREKQAARELHPVFIVKPGKPPELVRELPPPGGVWVENVQEIEMIPPAEIAYERERVRRLERARQLQKLVQLEMQQPTLVERDLALERVREALGLDEGPALKPVPKPAPAPTIPEPPKNGLGRRIKA